MSNEESHASVAEVRWRTRGGRATTAAVVRVDATTDDDEAGTDEADGEVDVDGEP
jgi:hypothetical protein